MVTPFRYALLLLLMIAGPVVHAQKNIPRYGDVKIEDFAPKAYSVDSSANAVVLCDIGTAVYESDYMNGFAISYERYKRIRILNKTAFDVATFSIPLFRSGRYEETIEKLEAHTCIAENGKVQVYKLEKPSIFTDKINLYLSNTKFTLPNLKEGCIIEVKYTVKSPYDRSIRPWSFQGNYPTMWSQFTVEIPEIFDYVLNLTGYQRFDMDVTKVESRLYQIPNLGTAGKNYAAQATIHTWGMAKVPALKEEIFTTTIDNYRSKIAFQLAKIKVPNNPPIDVIRDWFSVSKALMDDDNFGGSITSKNGWLKDELKLVVGDEKDSLEIAKKIFEFIRNNVKCTDHSALTASNSLKKCLQSKSGSVAEINLLLTAALINQGFHADPVLLSTRENGFVNETYPMVNQLNYVVCRTTIDGKSYNLDASYSKLGFGQLHKSCYNGTGRLINKQIPAIVNLSADSITSHKSTFVTLKSETKGKLTGGITLQLSMLESFDAREKLVTDSKESLFQQYIGIPTGIKLTEKEIENQNEYDYPVSLLCSVAMDTKDDVLYINPAFAAPIKDNPFKAMERRYPVEMPSAVFDNYVFMMDIPDGYTVDELPKSERINLNEDEGSFEYIVQKNEKSIQLRSTLKLKKANFLAEDYTTLRDLYTNIVRKFNEQIVLKRTR